MYCTSEQAARATWSRGESVQVFSDANTSLDLGSDDGAGSTGLTRLDKAVGTLLTGVDAFGFTSLHDEFGYLTGSTGQNPFAPVAGPSELPAGFSATFDQGALLAMHDAATSAEPAMTGLNAGAATLAIAMWKEGNLAKLDSQLGAIYSQRLAAGRALRNTRKPTPPVSRQQRPVGCHRRDGERSRRCRLAASTRVDRPHARIELRFGGIGCAACRQDRRPRRPFRPCLRAPVADDDLCRHGDHPGGFRPAHRHRARRLWGRWIRHQGGHSVGQLQHVGQRRHHGRRHRPQRPARRYDGASG